MSTIAVHDLDCVFRAQALPCANHTECKSTAELAVLATKADVVKAVSALHFCHQSAYGKVGLQSAHLFRHNTELV